MSEASVGIVSVQFDHEKLQVYQVSLEFAAFAAGLVKGLKGDFRSARDQLVRSSQSIALNIAEGNGKRSIADRRRFFEIARGSAMESAATLDVLVVCGAFSRQDVKEGKAFLLRIVAMLSKMTAPRPDMVREAEEEHRCEEGAEQM